MTLPWRPSQVTQILALIVMKTRVNAPASPGSVLNHMFVNYAPSPKPVPTQRRPYCQYALSAQGLIICRP